MNQMKFKGNQKQFELNAQIDSVFDRIRSANGSKNKQVDDLANEGKELIRKRQKLISELPTRALMVGKWSTNMFRMS